MYKNIQIICTDILPLNLEIWQCSHSFMRKEHFCRGWDHLSLLSLARVEGEGPEAGMGVGNYLAAEKAKLIRAWWGHETELPGGGTVWGELCSLWEWKGAEDPWERLLLSVRPWPCPPLPGPCNILQEQRDDCNPAGKRPYPDLRFWLRPIRHSRGKTWSYVLQKLSWVVAIIVALIIIVVVEANLSRAYLL